VFNLDIPLNYGDFSLEYQFHELMEVTTAYQTPSARAMLAA
jgi:hypothetical protein